MKELVAQIRKAVDAKLYYLALYVTLTLPDICGALEAKDGVATSSGYKAWFDQRVGPKYNGFLTGEDCYRLRCSLLHQGTSQHGSSSYSRYLFLEPSRNFIHCNVLNGALQLDIREFCDDVVAGVEQWLGDVEDSPLYRENLDKFMRRYPNGFAPYIEGVPVIA